MTTAHTFHIPVMGIAFTIDTPLKTAPFGIDSVISLVDDILIEKMREHYSRIFDLPYQAITARMEDFRARRITAYLDLLDELVKKRVAEIRRSFSEAGGEFRKYMDMMPDGSKIREEFQSLVMNSRTMEKIESWLKQHLPAGRIDVNIMTKLDRTNYRKGQPLPTEFNDAHAALRGFALSSVEAAVVLSAGMNPRLYSYMEQFPGFFPDASGYIRKQIILKVSDFRSALIQGKFLAKKGLWVSEFRIESGLNCGGHAFATDGYLMGPILEEFKTNRQLLADTQWEMVVKALQAKDLPVPDRQPEMRITAQGGVGTADEHAMLLDIYDLDSVGWGTPFLACSEVTTLDEPTRRQLLDAKEKDLFLSNISPLGVPFNSLRNNTKDLEKELRIREGRPGSPCPKQFVKLNSELSDPPICIASRQYQAKKLEILKSEGLSPDEYDRQAAAVMERSCICVGLGTPAYLVHNMDLKGIGPGVSVCPGPNMAYYDKGVNLREMCDHIYGRRSVVTRKDRPHMFIKELGLYVDYLRGKAAEHHEQFTEKQGKYLELFRENLRSGIEYYRSTVETIEVYLDGRKHEFLQQLQDFDAGLRNMFIRREETDTD